MPSNIQLKVSADISSAVQGIRQVNTTLGQMQASVQSAISRFSRIATSAVAVTGAVGAVAAVISSVVDNVRELVSAYSAQEQAETRLQAVLKATGNAAGMSASEMMALADSLQKVTTYTDQEIMAVEQMLASTRLIGREVMPEATKAVLDMAAATGDDAAGAAKDLAQALADPAGEIESLKEKGIQLTDAQAENIKKVQEQNGLYQAQLLLLQEVEGTYGGIAEAIGNTDTGKLTQLQNAWQDLKEGLGEVLMDSIDGLVDYTLSIVDQLSDYVARSNQAHDSAEWASGYIAAGDSSRVHTLTDDQLAAIVSNGIYSALYNDIQAGASYNLSPDEQASLGVYAEAVRQQELRARMGVWSAIDAHYGGAQPVRYNSSPDEILANQLDVGSALDDRYAQEREDAISAASDLINSNSALSISAQVASIDSRISEAWQAIDSLIETGGDSEGMIGMLEQIITSLEAQREVLTATDLPTGSSLAADYIRANSGLSQTAQLDQLNSEIWKASQYMADPSISEDQRTYLQEIIAGLNEEKLALLGVADAAEDAEDATSGMQSSIKDTLPEIISASIDLVGSIGDLFSTLADNAASALDEVTSKWDEYFTDLEAKQERQSETLSALLGAGVISYQDYIDGMNALDETRSEKQAEAQKEEEEAREKANQLAQAAFVAEQANALASATMTGAQAIMNVWAEPALPVWAKATYTGLVAATTATQIAAISSQQYTPMATGGIVTGPTHALIGEGGSPELVLPLNDENRDRFGLSGAGDGAIYLTINIGTAYTGDQLATDVFRGIEMAQRTGALPKWRYA